MTVEEAKRVVYASGTWDLLHDGHRNFLKKAKALGDFLVAGVNTDEFTRSYKGEPERDFVRRCKDVLVLPCVDAIVPHDSFTDLTGFEKYGVSVRAVGPEYGKHQGQEDCLNELEERGIEVVVLPRMSHISTTILKQRKEKK